MSSSVSARSGLVALLILSLSFGSTALLLRDDDPGGGGPQEQPGDLASDEGWKLLRAGSYDSYSRWELATNGRCERILVLPSKAPNRGVAFERSSGTMDCTGRGRISADPAAAGCGFTPPTPGRYWFAPDDYTGPSC